LQAEAEATSYNVVTIHESFYFRGHLCMSFSLHDISLYELIKRNHFRGISLLVIKSFAMQLLITLRFLRKLHIIHCDLKPENILLQHSSMSKLKVIDFGSSCFNHERSMLQLILQPHSVKLSYLKMPLVYNVNLCMSSVAMHEQKYRYLYDSTLVVVSICLRRKRDNENVSGVFFAVQFTPIYKADFIALRKLYSVI
jgi:serine/threonine protein kinase